jgi:hypothetical protein
MRCHLVRLVPIAFAARQPQGVRAECGCLRHGSGMAAPDPPALMLPDGSHQRPGIASLCRQAQAWSAFCCTSCERRQFGQSLFHTASDRRPWHIGSLASKRLRAIVVRSATIRSDGTDSNADRGTQVTRSHSGMPRPANVFQPGWVAALGREVAQIPVACQAGKSPDILSMVCLS